MKSFTTNKFPVNVIIVDIKSNITKHLFPWIKCALPRFQCHGLDLKAAVVSKAAGQKINTSLLIFTNCSSYHVCYRIIFSCGTKNSPI